MEDSTPLERFMFAVGVSVVSGVLVNLIVQWILED
jgi:hypothetical protein